VELFEVFYNFTDQKLQELGEWKRG